MFRNLIAAAVLATAFPFPAIAAWPERPIEFIVPFPAGGTVDVVARRFGEAFAEAIGQPAVIVNRDGGSGVIGIQAVANAQPDGYTLSFTPNGPLTVQPSLRKTPFSMASFRPICQVFTYPYVLAVAENSPIHSLADYINAAKGGNLDYAFGGVGTAPQFAALQLQQAAGVKMLGVPYRGDPPGAMALKGGEVKSAILTVEGARQQKFRMLAVFAEQRIPALPNVPTARELGYDVVASTMAGLIAPAKIGDDVAKSLEAACAKAVQGPRFVAAMKQMEQNIAYLPGDRFQAVLASDTESKKKLIETSGIRLEQ
jgi:tripartite-type tricarboxylate transporter receptor subunit TctC